MIALILFLLHCIDHFFRRDLTLIFMLFWVSLTLLKMSCVFSGIILWVSLSEIRFHSGSLTHKTCLSLMVQKPLKSPAWVASARIAWFQQFGSAFIIAVYPVLRLYQVTLLRTHCSSPCRSLSQFWHPLSKALLSWIESVASEWNR